MAPDGGGGVLLRHRGESVNENRLSEEVRPQLLIRVVDDEQAFELGGHRSVDVVVLPGQLWDQAAHVPDGLDVGDAARQRPWVVSEL